MKRKQRSGTRSLKMTRVDETTATDSVSVVSNLEAMKVSPKETPPSASSERE